MRILVTGGSGFLGRKIVERLAARGDSVIAFDLIDIPNGPKSSNVTVRTGDITDASTVLDAFELQAIDVVIHCAAIVGVTSTLNDPQKALDVNVGGTINVLNAMQDLKVPRMVHISSNEVYGDYQDSVIDEDHPTQPLMAYGISKLAAEQFCRTHELLYGIRSIHLRGAWIYAPDFPRARLPNALLDKVLAGESVHFGAGGDSIMDYLHANDFVDAVVAAVDKKRHRFDVYNVGSGVGTTLFELVDEVKLLVSDAEVSSGPGDFEFQPGIAMRIQGALDIQRAREELGFEPKHTLAAGLKEHIRMRSGL